MPVARGPQNSPDISMYGQLRGLQLKMLCFLPVMRNADALNFCSLKNVSPALHKSQARNKSHVHCTDHGHAANPMSTAQITGTQHVTCHMSTAQITGTQGVPCPLHKSQAHSMSHVHCTDHRHRCVGNPIFIYYRRISNSRLWRQVQGDQFLMLQKILTTSQP